MKFFIGPILLMSILLSVLSLAALKIIRFDSSWDRGQSIFFSKGFSFIESENSGDRCVFEMAIDTLTSYEMLSWGLQMQTWEKPSYEIWLKEHDYLYLLSIGLEDGVGTIWPWEEIGDNLISYSQGEYINFRFPKPVRIMTLCPICHRPLHEIVYISPLWTWKNYCGREGDLIYCPHCRIQWSFDCKALN